MRHVLLACVFVLAVTCGAVVIAVYQNPKPKSLDLPTAEFENFKTMAEGTPVCPSCGRSDQLGAYLFGLVRDVPVHDPPYILGGCVVHEKCPRYKCKACGTNFGLYSARRP